MNLTELTSRMLAAKQEIDDSLSAYAQAIADDADASDAEKAAKASAYLAASGPVAERQAKVDQTTAEVQKQARIADGMRRHAAKYVDSRMQWLSALQSLASLTKAEARLATWEPKETEGT